MAIYYDKNSNLPSTDTGVSRVKFGAGQEILETELNEVQILSDLKLGRLIAGLVGNCFLGTEITISGTTVTLKGGYACIAGRIVPIKKTGVSTTVTTNTKLCLYIKEAEVYEGTALKENGFSGGATVPNYLIDSRYGTPLSRRTAWEVYFESLPSTSSVNESADPDVLNTAMLNVDLRGASVMPKLIIANVGNPATNIALVAKTYDTGKLGAGASEEDIASIAKLIATLGANTGNDNTISVIDNATGFPTSTATSKGTVAKVLGWFATQLKRITGESNWWVLPTRSLKDLANMADAQEIYYGGIPGSCYVYAASSVSADDYGCSNTVCINIPYKFMKTKLPTLTFTGDYQFHSMCGQIIPITMPDIVASGSSAEKFIYLSMSHAIVKADMGATKLPVNTPGYIIANPGGRLTITVTT